MEKRLSKSISLHGDWGSKMEALRASRKIKIAEKEGRYMVIGRSKWVNYASPKMGVEFGSFSSL